MSKNINYLIPLLEWSEKNNKIIWRGKSLPLPLSKTNIEKITKEEISYGFGVNPNNSYTNKKGLAVKKGIFCKIKNKKYLLGTNNIFKATNSIKNLEDNEKILINNELTEEKIQNCIKTLTNEKIVEKNFSINNRGIQIKLSGRLGGVNKSMRYSQSEGSFKPQSFDSKLDFYYKPIYTKWGTIGLKIFLGH